MAVKRMEFAFTQEWSFINNHKLVNIYSAVEGDMSVMKITKRSVFGSAFNKRNTLSRKFKTIHSPVY